MQTGKQGNYISMKIRFSSYHEMCYPGRYINLKMLNMNKYLLCHILRILPTVYYRFDGRR